MVSRCGEITCCRRPINRRALTHNPTRAPFSLPQTKQSVSEPTLFCFHSRLEILCHPITLAYKLLRCGITQTSPWHLSHVTVCLRAQRMQIYFASTVDTIDAPPLQVSWDSGLICTSGFEHLCWIVTCVCNRSINIRTSNSQSEFFYSNIVSVLFFILFFHTIRGSKLLNAGCASPYRRAGCTGIKKNS